ncbi:hypothetical protein DFH07DRAFT_941102 [Mycena maculata]|uniref:Uncharacterized protein n=1 Tax=Mycena maculata TaxID=230809 RepID=A0AAD7IZZ7_9AGAR|nr:hypothetical protein DFH07DRAFT_941102 [Mycena maculata]
MDSNQIFSINPVIKLYFLKMIYRRSTGLMIYGHRGMFAELNFVCVGREKKMGGGERGVGGGGGGGAGGPGGGVIGRGLNDLWIDGWMMVGSTFVAYAGVSVFRVKLGFGRVVAIGGGQKEVRNRVESQGYSNPQRLDNHITKQELNFGFVQAGDKIDNALAQDPSPDGTGGLLGLHKSAAIFANWCRWSIADPRVVVLLNGVWPSGNVCGREKKMQFDGAGPEPDLGYHQGNQYLRAIPRPAAAAILRI